ncbi:hypothetical protein ScPMuIL_010764 [Solemya velum]
MKASVFLAFVLLSIGSCMTADSVFRFQQRVTGLRRLLSFSFKNCSNPAKGQLLVINSLHVAPDPVKLPGTVMLNFNITTRGDVTAPLKASVRLWKKILGIYVKVPCVGKVGSCDYADVCSFLERIRSCPKPFTQLGIPCKCPFKKGTYNLPQTRIDVQVKLPFSLGDVKLEAKLTSNKGNVGCYIFKATVKEPKEYIEQLKITSTE